MGQQRGPDSEVSSAKRGGRLRRVGGGGAVQTADVITLSTLNYSSPFSGRFYAKNSRVLLINFLKIRDRLEEGFGERI